MKLKFWELSEEEQKRVDERWEHLWSLGDDYKQFIDSPISFKLFREKYVGSGVPSTVSYIYDLYCLLHLHKKEIEELKKAIAEKSLVAEKEEVNTTK